jgi:peptidoglycan hydrolase FlgJ
MAALHSLASPNLAASALASSAISGGASLARPATFDAIANPGAKPDYKAKAHTAAVNFEAQFLNSMFGQMIAGLKGDGPFGGGQAVGVWRSFLSDQYAKSFAKAGGIGIANQVYHTLLAQQEARGADAPAFKAPLAGSRIADPGTPSPPAP